MKPRTAEKKTARIFSDIGGYYVCGNDLGYLDARGRANRTKAEALRSAHYMDYTHAVGSGTYWDGIRRIPAKYRTN